MGCSKYNRRLKSKSPSLNEREKRFLSILYVRPCLFYHRSTKKSADSSPSRVIPFCLPLFYCPDLSIALAGLLFSTPLDGG